MFDLSNRKIKLVVQRYGNTEYNPLLESFYLDCVVRNLAPKTLEGYVERLGYLFGFLICNKVRPNEIKKSTLHHYIVSLKGKVSDETINGRIRVLKVFFKYLKIEELIVQPDPAISIKLIRAEKRLKDIIDLVQKR